MNILLNGEIRGVQNIKGDNGNVRHQIQVESFGDYDKKCLYELTDFNKDARYVEGEKIVNMKVKVEVYNGEPTFYPCRYGKEVGNKPADEKKKPDIKI